MQSIFCLIVILLKVVFAGGKQWISSSKSRRCIRYLKSLDSRSGNNLPRGRGSVDTTDGTGRKYYWSVHLYLWRWLIRLIECRIKPCVLLITSGQSYRIAPYLAAAKALSIQLQIVSDSRISVPQLIQCRF